MNLLKSESIFILLGTMVGFGSLLAALVNCYIVNPTGLWSIKLIMGPFLLMYLFNGLKLSFYLSHMFISYLPEKTAVDAYLHNSVKFILSAVTSVIYAKLWNSFRYSALCIRFAECSEDEHLVITWTNNLTDIICGPPNVNYTNDECRRWVAQLPLIGLTILSVMFIHKIGELWDNQTVTVVEVVPTVSTENECQPKTKTAGDDSKKDCDSCNPSPSPPCPCPCDECAQEAKSKSKTEKSCPCKHCNSKSRTKKSNSSDKRCPCCCACSKCQNKKSNSCRGGDRSRSRSRNHGCRSKLKSSIVNLGDVIRNSLRYGK